MKYHVRFYHSYVTEGERMDSYSDSWNSSKLDDSTTMALNSVNSTVEDGETTTTTQIGTVYFKKRD
jgi:hypothetical protein